MTIKYNIDIDKKTIDINLKRIINQIYKLLPGREEGEDWEKPLDTIIEELTGMSRLFDCCQSVFLTLLCKLEGLYKCEDEDDFQIYRRTIFECLNMVQTLKDSIAEEE